MPVALGSLKLMDGSLTTTAELTSRGSLALVFLRHLGCVFCRRLIAQLNRYSDWNVALVVLAVPEDARAYFATHPTSFPVVCDPEARLYSTLGLRRGGMSAVASPRVFGRAIAALAGGAGMGRVTGDPMQLGGAFVLDAGQELVWHYRSVDAADNPSVEEIGRALGQVVAGG
ncbi:MAG: hypothetical protein IT207_03310 [Fimbriimonadaceae bacterium]|nr:hypothetical protein [Fimbriimonadaceae bacterium]